MSRSLRARGLKQCWTLFRLWKCSSRSLRARGLKHCIRVTIHALTLSRSLRARGLKRNRLRAVCANWCRALYGRVDWNKMITYAFALTKVALFTGAWIETPPSLVCRLLDKVALFTGAWIETILNRRLPPDERRSRSLRARGLKHKLT